MCIDSEECVWVLATVGDYIHPTAGSPRGEGGNVIYTLIMPAPLNTPPNRCNILDFYSPFPLHSFLPWAPCWYLLSLSWIQSSADAAVPLWLHVCERVHVCVCRMCQTEVILSPCLCRSHSLFFSHLHLPPSRCILWPSLPISPLYKSTSKEQGERPCNNSTLPPPMGN